MTPSQLETLHEMEAAWREFRHQLRGLNYSLDWKSNPAEDAEWSARDVIAHVLGTTERFLLVPLRKIVAGADPVIEIRGSDSYRSPETRALELPALVARVDSLYNETMGLVTAATEADLGHKAILRRADGTEQQRTCLELVQRLFCRHWLDHAGQVAKIREELGVAEL